jgi:hypothetical protein
VVRRSLIADLTDLKGYACCADWLLAVELMAVAAQNPYSRQFSGKSNAQRGVESTLGCHIF